MPATTMPSAVATMRRAGAVNAAASGANVTGAGQYASSFGDHTRGAACYCRVIARFTPTTPKITHNPSNYITYAEMLKLIYKVVNPCAGFMRS